MTDVSNRIHKLSPRQQELLQKRLREKKQAENSTSSAAAEKTAAARPSGSGSRSLDFTLFFFSADGTRTGEENAGANPYETLLEYARFGDRNGFKAVWTPERHFQAFGGLYPNPSVLAAGLATITENIGIRAGSLVLPLHSPVRVAEDWAVVDNLSGGRVGISFATGWHAHDFVISPDNYADRRALMFRNIPVVQRLWAGEEVELPGVDGKPTAVRTLPRPVQRELPFWITASSPKTWREAGEIGGNVLGSMIGLSVEQIADLVREYRRARTRNGHDPRKGVITLMLHTYLGEDLETTREKVRKPMKGYLSNFIDQFRSLTEDVPADSELDVLLEHAFDRYFETSSLLGTVEKCKGLVTALADAGVDEAACLVDFGLDAADTAASLERLAQLRRELVQDESKREDEEGS